MGRSDKATSGRRTASREALDTKADLAMRQLAIAEQLAGLGTWAWRSGSNVVDCSTGLARILGLGEGKLAASARSLLRRVAASQRKRLLTAIRSAAPSTITEIAVLDSRGQSRTI